jgi:hypothetical protein
MRRFISSAARAWRLALLLTAIAAALTVGVVGAVAEDDPQPIDFTHNSLDADAPVPGGVFGSGPSFKTGQAICTTAVQSVAGNVNTDCDATAPNGVTNPHNETSIAVNPTNSLNILGGANDYQLGINPGGHVSETLRSFAHVSFDGGQSWSEYPINSNSSYQATGDPAVAFDATGHAYYATLGFRFVGPANATNPDVLVANSGDGGRSWDVERIASGSGTEASVGDLLDKEYIAAWGAGNAIVTYGDFRADQPGSFATGTIFASVTHDYGKTWTKPTRINGTLDQSFVSVPTVAADGKIYVAFLNTDFLDPSDPVNLGRDTYYVVQVDPATGAAVSAPHPVAKVIDGANDYPIAGGRQTYEDSLFRTWAAGNITADPTNARHLAVVWSDMRNSTLPAPRNPYAATTNSDVIVSESFNGGTTWSTPTAITRSNDQFMPWGAFDGAGKLRVGFFDRSYDTANHLYGYTLATAPASTTAATSSSFGFTQVSTTLSDPTKNDRWFRATVDPAFPAATQFIGDYSNIAVVPTGVNGSATGVALGTSVVAYWTDMRNQACFPAGVCGWGEDAYFGRVG